MQTGIIELDVHGCTVEEAIKKIRKKIYSASNGVYRIRIIHGYHRGTRIREGIRQEFGYGLESRVKRIESGQNQGITELVLREY